jgi:hypothetical protein
VRIKSRFQPNRGPQAAFAQCPARIIGYGGAMGGGKSRAICERMFDYALEHPGMVGVLARQKHTAIVETTKKTMIEEVVPPALISWRKASQGEDFIDLVNGSRIHFIGLDDPARWYSSEISVLMVDQVEECDEESIVKLITRLRRKQAPVTKYTGRLALPDDKGVFHDQAVTDYPLPGKVVLSFNPENPGHWLQKWFIHGAERTGYGFRKPELVPTDAAAPIGDAEFFFAKVTDNPHVGTGYMAGLAGLPERMRRRYLEGLWEFIAGNCYFDEDALAYYERLASSTAPILNGYTVGDVSEDFQVRTRRQFEKPKEPLKFKAGQGPWTVWRNPVRGHRTDDGTLVPAHRYVMGADTSSGGSTDYSGIQVFDVDAFEIVAEYQGKIDPDLLAVEAYRCGRIYNNALAVPETTGGWGFSVLQELKRLRYPNMYTRSVLDRLTKKWTDVTGWDTSVKTRPYMLDTLEKVLRERELGLYSLRAVSELGTFVRDDAGRPAAQPGCNDDLVVSLAIAVTVGLEQPKQLKRPVEKQHEPSVSSVTGY